MRWGMVNGRVADTVGGKIRQGHPTDGLVHDEKLVHAGAGPKPGCRPQSCTPPFVRAWFLQSISKPFSGKFPARPPTARGPCSPGADHFGKDADEDALQGAGHDRRAAPFRPSGTRSTPPRRWCGWWKAQGGSSRLPPYDGRRFFVAHFMHPAITSGSAAERPHAAAKLYHPVLRQRDVGVHRHLDDAADVVFDGVLGGDHPDVGRSTRVQTGRRVFRFPDPWTVTRIMP